MEGSGFIKTAVITYLLGIKIRCFVAKKIKLKMHVDPVWHFN